MSCAASNPTLPSLLRSIYNTEFSSSHRLPTSLRQHRPLLLSPSCHSFRHHRHFSSSPRFSSQSEGPSPSEVSSSPNKVPKTESFLSRDKDSNAKRHSQSGSNTKQSNRKPETKPLQKKPEGWRIQKEALKNKFQEGWNPPKKLSPDAVDGIRQLHGVAPAQFTTPVLAEKFKVTPEAIRRILKSKWRPTEAEAEVRQERWHRRHRRIWSQMTELGLRPPKESAGEVSDSKVLYDDDRKRPI